MTLFFHRVTPVLALCLAPVASAFPGAADPTQPAPGAPLPPYRSAFSDYKPLKEDKPGDWRALNDAARQEGMADMPGMAKDAHDGMPGMGKTPGHAMSMAMPKVRAAAGPAKARALAPAASMPAMPAMKGMQGMQGMPGTQGHPMHDMQGGKP